MLIVRPEARADLRDAARYYRNVAPPALGKKLAARLMTSFRDCIHTIEALAHTRPEHPDIPGARFVAFPGFPYLVFYTVNDDGNIYVVAIEYATSDYVEQVPTRVEGLPE